MEVVGCGGGGNGEIVDGGGCGRVVVMLVVVESVDGGGCGGVSSDAVVVVW